MSTSTSTLCWLLCAAMMLGVACAEISFEQVFSPEELQKYGPKGLIQLIKSNYPNIAEVCWSQHRGMVSPGGGGVLPAAEVTKFKEYIEKKLMLLHIICKDTIYEHYKD